MRIAIRACAFSALILSVRALGAASGDFHDWAPSPPMGWNSWDCFATTVTEAMVHGQADVLAGRLAGHGWQYLVVDIQWYEPSATGFDYHADAKLTMDGFGRLMPALNKFPSAADDKGFSSLAAYLHSRNLKFGVHLMRGIPRQAVERNLPIKGTPYHAADIADKMRVCPWNTDMYGVDMSKPGAQEYYDSVFELIASWGVDFVKVDDLSRPYIRNEPEVEAVRRAIDRSGRKIVLSLSPGETDINAAAHVVEHANMWRISDDFWDHWSLLEAQFERLRKWSPWRRPGAWPDADMIPIGTIDLGRQTWFSHDEEVTLMTLWSVARSPLMLGADLTKLDGPTLSLIDNDEVLAVDRDSAHNRQLFRKDDGEVAWAADAPGGRDVYVALFNTRDPWVLSDAKRIWSGGPVSMKAQAQEVPFKLKVEGLKTVVLVADDHESPRFWWPSIFRDVRWVMADGKVLPAGRDYGSHGERVNGLEVPDGAAELLGTARLDDAAREDAKGEAMTFRAFGFAADDLRQKAQNVGLDFSQLGLSGRVKVRNLWLHKDIGEYSGTFTQAINWHGAGLYRLTPLGPKSVSR